MHKFKYLLHSLESTTKWCDHKYTISNHLQLSHFTQATYHTEVSDDIGMLVGFPEQLHLTVSEAEALRQQALHRHLPMVKHTSAITNIGKHL